MRKAYASAPLLLPPTLLLPTVNVFDFLYFLFLNIYFYKNRTFIEHKIKEQVTLQFSPLP